MKSWGHPLAELHESKVAKQGKKLAVCKKFWGVKKSNPGGVMKEVKTNTPKYSKSNMRLSFYACLNRWPSKSF